MCLTLILWNVPGAGAGTCENREEGDGPDRRDPCLLPGDDAADRRDNRLSGELLRRRCHSRLWRSLHSSNSTCGPEPSRPATRCASSDRTESREVNWPCSVARPPPRRRWPLRPSWRRPAASRASPRAIPPVPRYPRLVLLLVTEPAQSLVRDLPPPPPSRMLMRSGSPGPCRPRPRH